MMDSIMLKITDKLIVLRATRFPLQNYSIVINKIVDFYFKHQRQAIKKTDTLGQKTINSYIEYMIHPEEEKIISIDLFKQPEIKALPESLHSTDKLYECSKLCGVYFLCKNKNVVYVGASLNTAKRVTDHKDKKFNKIYFILVPSYCRFLIEYFYIKSLKPKYNNFQPDKHFEGVLKTFKSESPSDLYREITNMSKKSYMKKISII